jgi:hypothetical protein
LEKDTVCLEGHLLYILERKPKTKDMLARHAELWDTHGDSSHNGRSVEGERGMLQAGEDVSRGGSLSLLKINLGLCPGGCNLGSNVLLGPVALPDGPLLKLCKATFYLLPPYSSTVERCAAGTVCFLLRNPRGNTQPNQEQPVEHIFLSQ